jgi:protein-S-isoprenylcysteine O-methyltransferase Ste14
MRPLPFTWPAGLAFWLAYLWAWAPESALVRRARRSPAARGADDAGSLRLIMAGGGVALLAAFLLAGLDARARIAAPWLAYVAGIGLLLAGSLLRRHCFRRLGAQFTGAVEVRAEHEVVTTGAYRWVRHPSYSAALLMYAGIGLALGNWASLAVLLVVPLATYVYRITVEERALARAAGPAYAAYRARTRYRMLPFVY